VAEILDGIRCTRFKFKWVGT